MLNKDDFFAWLSAQVDREDPVGDLARDRALEVERGGGAATLGEFRDILTVIGADEALDALYLAELEWAGADG